MIRVRVDERDAGQRLDKYLRRYLSEAPSGFLYKMLRKKNITLNEKKASGNETLRAGDEVAMFLSDDTIRKFGGRLTGQNDSGEIPERDKKRYQQYQEAYEDYGALEIVYENKHVLVVNKPAGMLTQKAAPSDRSLNEWLIGYLLSKGEIDERTLHTFKPSVCNRLDRNTSGLVLCGKTLAGSRKIGELLRDRSLRKFYSLYVKGVVTKSAQIDGSIVKDENTNKVKLCRDASDGEAIDIQTIYKPVKNYRHITLLEAELITGKTHQIRVHLAGIGHPVIGDYKYGYLELNDRYKKKYGITSQMLHAIRLEFPGMEGEWADMSGLVLTAEPPEIFRILDEGEG